MSAAQARAGLAAIGRDLHWLDGDGGVRRGAALLKAVGGVRSEAGGLADLQAAPAWLRAPRDRQRRLAHAVGLAALAPKLASSIDGAWLGGLAKVAGEDLLDWAIERAGALPRCDAPPTPPERLAALGFGLLGAGLAPGLRGYLAEQGAEGGGVCPAQAVDAYLFAALQVAPLQ